MWWLTIKDLPGKEWQGTGISILHIVSEAVLPRLGDWPLSACMTGYCFLERGKEWQPSFGLQDFLDGGPPPVYIGFGFMAGRNPQKLAEMCNFFP